MAITLTSFLIDEESARKSILEGIMFPGIISLFVNLNALFPFLFVPVVHWLELNRHGVGETALASVPLLWLTLAMVGRLRRQGPRDEPMAQARTDRPPTSAGYGAFLCAVTFGSYVKELRGASMQVGQDREDRQGRLSPRVLGFQACSGPPSRLGPPSPAPTSSPWPATASPTMAPTRKSSSSTPTCPPRTREASRSAQPG